MDRLCSSAAVFCHLCFIVCFLGYNSLFFLLFLSLSLSLFMRLHIISSNLLGSNFYPTDLFCFISFLSKVCLRHYNGLICFESKLFQSNSTLIICIYDKFIDFNHNLSDLSLNFCNVVFLFLIIG